MRIRHFLPCVSLTVWIAAALTSFASHSNLALGQSLAGATTNGTDISVSSVATVSQQSTKKSELDVKLLQLPLAFEANRGQTESQVKYLARGQGYALFLTSDEAVLSLSKASPRHRGAVGTTAAVRVRLVGGNTSPEVTGEDELAGNSNYFLGSDPHHWRTNVSQYGRVQYRGVYPGIDLIYYGNQRQLEYDMVVSPGADPKQLCFEVEGVKRLRLNSAGDLVLHTSDGDVLLRKPVIYQENGGKKLIAGGYRIQSGHRFGFEIGEYDRSKLLIIDPVLSYSTYIGGSLDDWFGWMAVEASGNAYAVGFTQSANFPVVNPISTNASYGGGSYDGTIVKLNATGTARLYSTYLGGNGDEWVRGITLDSTGNAYVTGYTSSSNFPTVNAYQPTYGGGNDAFIAKLGPSGSSLLYSSYLGGTGDDIGRGIVLDSAGKAYVVGSTSSNSNFPIANALQGAYGGGVNDGFVAKFDLSRSGAASLQYSTLLGDSGDDRAVAVAVDHSDNLYVVGSTTSTTFPTLNPYQANNAGGADDTFVSEINASGTALVFSTYLGGAGDDLPHGIAVDSSGIYVDGDTTSTNFPTLKPIQATNRGAHDLFVSKLAPGGSSLLFSTYYGGSSDDYCQSMALNNGLLYVSGMTGSPNFPLVSPIQQQFGGGNVDGMVVVLDSQGTQVSFSTFFGGSSFEEIQGIAVDPQGSAVYLAGETYSPNLRVTSGVVQPTYGGRGDAFLAKITLGNAPIASLSSSSLSFGSQALNTTSAGLNLNLTNTGSASLSISSLAASGNFTETDNCAGQTLLVSGSCTVTVRSTPSLPGAIAGVITIRDNAGNSPQLVSLSGNGIYAVSLSPANLSFGGVNINSSSAPLPVTLTNNQRSPLTFSFFASGNYVAAPGNCGSSLPANASCTLQVTFSPTNSGTIAGGLTVQHNAAFSPQVVGLNGTGVTAQALTFSPAALTFGKTAVGTSSGSSTVTVTNVSSGSVSIASLTASGNFAAAGNGATPCSGALAAGAKCTFGVTFRPTVTGAATGSVTISDSAAGSPQVFSVSGSGVLPVALSPASITFPATGIGQTSGSVVVTMTNQSGTSLTVSSITASGQYNVSPTGSAPCANGSTVPALGTCTFSVNFSPTALGTINGAITVIHNAAFSPQEVQVTGTGQ